MAKIALNRTHSTGAEDSNAKIEARDLLSGVPLIFFMLFFLSGMCALIYEIAWTRRLTLIFGNTVYSVSTVLVAFMGGLAFGSLLFGRFVDKRDDPIRIYGWLEIGIGISAIALPLALSAMNPAYRYLYGSIGAFHFVLHLARFALSTLVLIIPTTFMGATLPVLSKFIVRRVRKTGLGIGSLYAINTLGAVVGCFLAGFVLISWLGVSRSEQIAAAINILAGLTALFMHYRYAGTSLIAEETGEAEKAVAMGGYRRSTLRLVLLIFGISGMLALAYEVVWTRILVFFLGSSIYSFSMILMVYLLGLTAGSFIASRIVDGAKRPLQMFGWLEILIGLCTLIGLSFFSKLPFETYQLGISPGYYIRENFVCTLAIILPPTLLMGATFPVAIKIYARNIGAVGEQTGTVYAVNTVGAIVGSFIAGFVFIPVLGSKNSLIFLVFMSIVAGFLLLHMSMKQEHSSSLNWAAGAFVILPIIAFPLRNDLLKEYSLRVVTGERGKVIAFDEDSTAAVSVVENRAGGRILSVNGVAMTMLCTETQLMAHIPLALLDNPENYLNICFGMGTTFVSARRAGVEVDLVELCPFVVEAFRYFQDDPSMLDEQGVGKIISDGRNYLLLSDKKYDVVSIDPPPPSWSAGTVNLYTKEFYELCKSRLKPGGIVCQWFPTCFNSLSEKQYKILVRTFIEVFPHTTVWNSPDTLGTYLLGTFETLQIDEDSFNAYFAKAPIREDMSLYAAKPMTGSEVLDLFLLNEDQASLYVEGAPVMTDDTPWIEFPLFRNGPGVKIMRPEYISANMPGSK